MKVRILVGMAGPTVVRHRGDIAEVDDGEAQRLIAAGYAELIDKARQPARGPERERA